MIAMAVFMKPSSSHCWLTDQCYNHPGLDSEKLLRVRYSSLKRQLDKPNKNNKIDKHVFNFTLGFFIPFQRYDRHFSFNGKRSRR